MKSNADMFAIRGDTWQQTDGRQPDDDQTLLDSYTLAKRKRSAERAADLRRAGLIRRIVAAKNVPMIATHNAIPRTKDERLLVIRAIGEKLRRDMIAENIRRNTNTVRTHT